MRTNIANILIWYENKLGKCIVLSYPSLHTGGNIGARERFGIWPKCSTHSQDYHTNEVNHNIFKADRKWHLIIYNHLPYSPACIVFRFHYKKYQMHLKLTPPYSCYNKRNEGEKKPGEMKSHLHTSGNNHVVQVRPQGQAALPERHSTAPLRNQSDAKGSKKENKRIHSKLWCTRI